MEEPVDFTAVNRLFGRLVSAYRKIREESPRISELRNSIKALEAELSRVKILDSEDKKKIKWMKLKLKRYKSRLEELENR